MKKLSKRIGALVLSVLLAAALMPTANAADEIKTGEKVGLQLSYKDGETALGGVLFELYRVADTNERGDLTPTEAFAAYGFTTEIGKQDDWSALAQTLKGCAFRDKLAPTASGETDASGRIEFPTEGENALTPGLYLLIGSRCTTPDNYTYSVIPAMLFLPGLDEAENEWVYDVSVTPKFTREIDPPDDPGDKFVTRKALKIWDDEGYESIRPASVEVQLLKDREVYDTQTLTAANNWRFTWDKLPAEYEWTVVEKEIEDYTVKVEKTGVTFKLTNKYVPSVIGHDPPVQKKITGSGYGANVTFRFTLTPKESTYPMPAGSENGKKTVEIKGAGSTEFGYIKFTEPGVYEYTVTEENTGEANFAYDTKVFTITYTVEKNGNGGLDIVRRISDNGGNNDLITVEFDNTYTKPDEPNLPQTGQLWWPVPVLLIAGLALLIAGSLRRRKGNG